MRVAYCRYFIGNVWLYFICQSTNEDDRSDRNGVISSGIYISEFSFPLTILLKATVDSIQLQ